MRSSNRRSTGPAGRRLDVRRRADARGIGEPTRARPRQAVARRILAAAWRPRDLGSAQVVGLLQVLDFPIVCGDGVAQAGGRVPVEGRRQDRAENTRLRAVIGQRDAEPFAGELVPPRTRDALDEPAQPEPAQVVGHAPGTVVVDREPAQRGHRLPEFAVAEAPRQQVEAEQGGEERLHPPVPEAQGRGALSVDGQQAVQLVERVGSDHRVVAEALDAEQASVGREADLLQILKVAQPAADIEVVRVVDHRLGTAARAPPCGTA